VPGCPLEFCFLADWFFQRVGIRDRVELTYVTPLDGAFTKPVAAKALAGLLEEKGVALVTEFNTGEVDGSAGRLISYDGREVGFDLAVVVHFTGASYVARSPGLGDELGFVRWMSTRCSRWPSRTSSPSAMLPACRRPKQARSLISRGDPGRERQALPGRRAARREF